MALIDEIIFTMPYFFIAALGAAIHFVKVKVQAGDKMAWSDYWKVNQDKSILAALTIIGAIYLAFVMNQLTGVAAFGIGYGFDSALNKWDKKTEEENK